MRFFALTAVASLLSAVSAANITVMVGQNGTLTYSPSSATAQVGDVVAFQFMAKNHTLTQSSFTAPCSPLASGITSGFQPVASGATTFPQYSFTVKNASAPMWFYCQQTGHCGQGMVFALNPTAQKTFAAFQAAALATASNGTSGGYGSPGGAGTGTTVSAGSSTAGSGSTTASAGTTSSSSKPASGAMAVGGKAAAFLTIAGLVAGLNL